MAAPSEDILTIEALAAYLQISKSTLYKLVQDGRLPGQKVGKRWRFHKDAIDQWLKQHPGDVKETASEESRESPDQKREGVDE